MVLDRPDFSQAVVPSMPVIGEGQVPWFESEAIEVDAESYEDLINYVVPDGHELHVCSGVVSGNFPCHQRYALRQTPAATWISPTGHIDASGNWLLPENAYDGNVSNAAMEVIATESWGDYLQLLINATNIDKIKFYAYYFSPGIDQVDIDVYYEGDWHDVYEGAYASQEWVEKDILAGVSLISKARVRFYNSYSSNAWVQFREFMFNTSGTTPQEAIYFDTHAIIPYQPQAPYLVGAEATFVIRVYNDDDAAHIMTACIAGFLQKKV